MSLPTYAKFYNVNNQEIGEQFFNVGWRFDFNTFMNEVNRLKNDGCDLFDKCHYFIVYGFKIKKRYMELPETWEKV